MLNERRKISVPVYGYLLTKPDKRITARITERITVNGYNNYIATLENGKRFYCVIPQRGQKGHIIIDDTQEIY